MAMSTSAASAIARSHAGWPPGARPPQFIIGDGQVSLGSQVIKPNAKKVRLSTPPPYTTPRLPSDGSVAVVHTAMGCIHRHHLRADRRAHARRHACGTRTPVPPLIPTVARAAFPGTQGEGGRGVRLRRRHRRCHDPV
eukprot:scaffold13579_cov106-Isochrysis_galbana.AAC.2